MRKAATGFFACILACILLFLAVFAVGCTVPIVDFRVGTFRDQYEVDEAFDPADAKLELQNADGTRTFLPLSADMVTGFDTKTSGTRVLTIAYQGIKKTSKYTVLGDIKTTTRLKLTRGVGTECVVKVVAPDLEIWAISFLLTGSLNEISGDFLVPLKGWTAKTKRLSNGIKVLLYTETKQPLKGEAVVCNFLCGGASTFLFSEISVASTTVEYSVPNATLSYIVG